MLAQGEDTGRQEGSSEEGTRRKGAYSHNAMDGGARQACKRLAGEQKVGLPLQRSRETQAGHKDPCRDVVSTRVGISGRGEGVPSQQLGGWGGRRQPRHDDWGWENLSMERRGLWAMAARNLAISLLHDITPAGRGRAAPSTGGKGAGPGCRISLIRAQPRQSPSRGTHQSHSSTDQSRTHVRWAIWGGPCYREAAGHRNRREGISHVGNAVPSQCWRVTGPSGSQCSAGDLQLHLVAPWPGLLRLQREGAGEGKS